MRAFQTWQAAHNYAQAYANKTGLSLGIEQVSIFGEWTAHFIPKKKEDRYGRDHNCEAVEPMKAKL